MFTPQEFKIPKLKGISEKSIEEHLKLYQGYVKNANHIFERGGDLAKDSEGNSYEISELERRFSFEFNGMRNHEYYFSSLESGPSELSKDGALYKEMEKTCGSYDVFIDHFKKLALTRGIGWAFLYWDKKTNKLLTQWIDEQHLGHLSSCAPILALDMWEHSYVFDYNPSGKKQYIEDFFANLNWSVIEDNFDKAKK